MYHTVGATGQRDGNDERIWFCHHDGPHDLQEVGVCPRFKTQNGSLLHIANMNGRILSAVPVHVRYGTYVGTAPVPIRNLFIFMYSTGR